MPDGLGATMMNDGWNDLLTKGSLADLQEHFARNNATVPSNLLHVACQQPTVDDDAVAKIRFLVEHLPHQLTVKDDSHKIPLHHVVCQQPPRSLLTATLSILHVLLQAAPETIVMRLQEDDNDDGILPALLAHHHGASATIVQYLLRRQLTAHQGLIVTHNDLSCLLWNEASFWHHVATVIPQVPAAVLQQIRLVECRLSYTSWQELQVALQALPPGHLTRLQLLQLHIWYVDDHTTHRQQQRLRQQADGAFWQSMVETHKHTLVTLEMPHFYALTTASVQCMAQCLARHEFPVLQVLDARTPLRQPRPVKHTVQFVETLARAVRDPSCRLESLALGTLTASELQFLLQKGIQANRSLEYFQVETILFDNNNNKCHNGWKSLRQVLCRTLQHNTSLERFVAPRPLIQCDQVQLYLQLNREYHRRDMGHWSPTLVAHVLAKAKQEVLQQAREEERYYFPTVVEVPDPRSAMFYILQSRPDIIVRNHKSAGSSTTKAMSKQ